MTSERGPFPPWIRKRLPPESQTRRVRDLLGRLRLHTVCQSAHCPNLFECFGRGTATFMILGNRCTRNCRFCAVEHGSPEPPDPDEPGRVAEAAVALGLKHIVVTSVTRDDLRDGGSRQFAATIAAIRASSQATVEVLTPDFGGRCERVDTVLDAHPDVFNHNIETVPRLYPLVRPEASYERSLGVLGHARARGADLLTKSGLMVGLGETHDEVRQVMRDLRSVGCDLLTVGQYLAPSRAHLPVERFVRPEEFDAYKVDAEAIGFRAAASGPFVRSSYEAGTLACGLMNG